MAMALKIGAKSAASHQKDKLELTLDCKTNIPPTDLRRYAWLIYGNKGIGKTSLASRFEGAFFLALEPGTKGLRVASKPVPDWEHFVGYIDLLVNASNPKLTVIVDTIDLAYDYAFDFECKRLKIDNPREENDFGATWRRIRKMFRQQIERLMLLPGGVVFVSHDTEKEVTLIGSDGAFVTDRVQPTIARQGLMEIEGLVDIVAYYGYDMGERCLWLDGSQQRVAKCRPEDNFLVKGTTDRVTCIPMGTTSQQAYDNLLRAFDNQQLTATPQVARPIKPKMALSGTKK